MITRQELNNIINQNVLIMKRLANNFICAAAILVAAAVAFSSCDPQEKKVEPKVEVSESEITSESAGETYDITVTSNVAWTAQIANKDTWVTVKPASGEAGETPVKITVKKNNSETPRETEITFTGETSTATIAVKQFSKDVVRLDKTAYEATVAGGTDAVQVTANTDWTATVSEGADWVTVAPATGAAGETAATVTVAANATAEARTAKVTFTAGDAKAEYTISQEAVSVTLSQNSITDAGEGTTATVNITSNVAWTAASSAEWVTVAPAAGEAGVAEVTVTVAENPSEEARTAQVTFTANENVSVELTVTQAYIEQAGKIAIEVTNITATKATATCTPDPLTGFTYYYDYLPKEEADLLMPTDEDKIGYIVQSINEALANYPDLSWADLIEEGVAEDTLVGLAPLTEYYAIAFGIDAGGNVTTKLYKEEFTTQDLNPALKEWVGTWEVTSTHTFYREDGGKSGQEETPTTRTITIGTESAGFGIELDEAELIVAGLSYTDALGLFGEGSQLETIGTVNDKGEFELKNQFEIYDATDIGLGVFTWIGYCKADDDGQHYITNGNYPPYTLAFGADKTSGTGTPGRGKWSDGVGFTAVYYDMWIVTPDGKYQSYYSQPGYGILSGNWTLKKVEAEPSATPQSIKIETKVAKQIKIKENNLVKNLNSSYLYKSAQVR